MRICRQKDPSSSSTAEMRRPYFIGCLFFNLEDRGEGLRACSACNSIQLHKMLLLSSHLTIPPPKQHASGRGYILHSALAFPQPCCYYKHSFWYNIVKAVQAIRSEIPFFPPLHPGLSVSGLILDTFWKAEDLLSFCHPTTYIQNKPFSGWMGLLPFGKQPCLFNILPVYISHSC